MTSRAAEQSIFAEALQRSSPEERARYLDAACAGDESLRCRVENLLRASEEAADFLERPATELELGRVMTVGPSMSEELNERPGDRIGRYKLLEKIGEGGCGVVYRAEQEEPVRRPVALKIIKPGMDTRQVIARFQMERQTLALMDHPNISKVFDAGATGHGRPFFVMELVGGVRITEFCDEAGLGITARLRLFAQVCQAIQHAHQKGIIHRDLKPSNILVTLHDGVPVPKVIDFGIAKATGERLSDKTLFTQFHAFIGTPAYTSPEQAELSSVDIDTRSDIYSLGILLYELLTGRTPFDGEELLRSGLDEMRRIIRQEEPPAPSVRLTRELERVRHRSAQAEPAARRPAVSHPRGSIGPTIDVIKALRGDLDWIVMKCLEKDRGRRYESASALAADVLRHLNHEPVTARPASVAYTLQKLACRHRTPLLAAGASLAALILAVVVLAVGNARVRRERNEKAEALRDRSTALEAVRASEQEAREQLFQALKNQALAFRHSGRMGQRTESLATVLEASRIRRDADLRDHAMAAMALPDIERGRLLSGPAAASVDVAFDPAYRLVARIVPDGSVVVSTLDGGAGLHRLPAQAVAGDVIQFSPNSRYLAHSAEDGVVRLWELQSARSVLEFKRERRRAIAFSPDNRLFAVSEEAAVSCLRVADGSLLRRWKTPDRPHALEFHPDNHRLAVGFKSAPIVSIYDVAEEAPILDLPVGPIDRVIPTWHPGGRLMALAGTDPRIRIWDTIQRTNVAVLDGHAQRVTVLKFHPRGDILVSMSWDNSMRLWHPVPGRLIMRRPAMTWRGFSEDGRWAGVMSGPNGGTHLWGILPSPEFRTFVGGNASAESSPYEGNISSDGTMLALGAEDGVRLWDIRGAQEIHWLAMQPTFSALFRKEGQELLTCGYAEGVRRWPIERDLGPGRSVRVGPPVKIPLPFRPERIALSADERYLAVVADREGTGQVLDLETGRTLVPSLRHSHSSVVAFSADAQHVATAGWHSERVRLWSATTGELVHKWELGAPGARIFFTPDCRELIVCRIKEFTFHDVRELEVTRHLTRDDGLYPGHVAFTSDGKLMAMEMTPGVIDLKDAATSRTVARIENPAADGCTWMDFTPDGGQLLVAAQYANSVVRWDLRAMRARLKSMKLDWEWPDFSPIVDARQRKTPAVNP
jgi:serine/threonine protein kinase/WD40 repeat protein